MGLAVPMGENQGVVQRTGLAIKRARCQPRAPVDKVSPVPSFDSPSFLEDTTLHQEGSVTLSHRWVVRTAPFE